MLEKVKERRGRKQLLNVLKVMRGCWKLKEEALHRTVWEFAVEQTMGQS